ncbi:MAG: Crp/Fnr family transcriptional regulator [Cyanobacteria bacterium P01_H01_bin.58]
MASPIDVSQLQAISLFAGLNDAVLAQLAAHARLRQYPQDDRVFQEGDALPACLHVLVSGRLQIAKVASSGKETILRILKAGEVFAAPAIFGNGQAPATATAIEPIVVLTIERQALLDGFSQSPELALHLLGVFNQRLQELHNQMHGLVSQRAIVRLVNYLQSMAEYTGADSVAGGEQLRSRLTYYQIARSIGITYEECVRLFKQLQPAVTYRRGGIITIRDRQQLKSLDTD